MMNYRRFDVANGITNGETETGEGQHTVESYYPLYVIVLLLCNTGMLEGRVSRGGGGCG
ncbi:hypothetical protein J6590_019939 [Homalodisca vitripennis]|nr:hypothetical protein J6590_091599 [Homalodisca vitripennis]KAG8337538.1 hypothetical protein J6590_019939 [Homalodisca vitripennis]